ncbi:MAG: hypothetical protein FWC13_02310 [Oscillospiraceae bacterium]|nr:hypothetical protein [Oscillospiraceae bacterium]
MKFIIAFVLCVVILSDGIVAVAVDLPIDISVINQDVGTGEAHTANRNIEILTPNAGEITRAIGEQSARQRETAILGLFLESGNQTVIKYEQISSAAYGFGLFSEPTDFSGTRVVTEDNSISTWLVVVIFSLSAIGGFLLAVLLIQRKRGANVH